jgi:hypothetical protein
MATRMQQRKGTAAQWISTNGGDGPVLNAGEIGFESDTNKFKIGDGVNHWVDLTYFTDSDAALAAINSVIDAAPAALNTLNELAAAINDDPAFFTTIATNLSNHESDSLNVHGISDTAELATKTFANTAVSNHQQDTTEVHGIADTTALATKTYADTAVSTHNDDTTNVHGIADTADLATKSYADTAEADAITAAGTAADTKISTHNSNTTNVHGILDTSLLATTSATASAISTAVSDHNTDTTNVHGIADTSQLATASDLSTAVSTHNSDTTEVHGIADTSILVTTTGTQTLTHKTLTTPTINGGEFTATGGTPRIHGIYLPDSHFITFEGATNNEFETVLAVIDPTADHTISLPNETGTVQLRVADVSDTEIGYLNGVTSAIQTQINSKAPTADPTFTGTVSGITKSMVGLGNADNTSDANKPVSTATQTALDAKASLAGATFTGNVEVDGNLVVDGDFTVNGTNFNASATSITIEDNLLQLAHTNPANTVDLGLVVAYNDGTAKHSGLARDVSDNKWKLFNGVTTEPATTVAFGEGSLDALAVGALEATTVTPSSGVVFSDGTQTKEGVPSRTPIVQKTASYALSTLTHRDSLIEVSSTDATTITIPEDATVNYPIGTTLDILQTNTGQVTIAPVSGSVTVNATPGLKLRTRWSSATLMKRAANTWVVFGDLTA